MKRKKILEKLEKLNENANGILVGGFTAFAGSFTVNNCTSTNTKNCTESPSANNCHGTNCMIACGN